MSTQTCFYKRFRMEFDLTRDAPGSGRLPAGFIWQAWKAGLEERHAAVKVASFQEELDATVFESLGEFDGCLRLMREISRQSGFLPRSTWLIGKQDGGQLLADCGTIQALATTDHLASIQNVGVAPRWRGLGLGRALVEKCLLGCREAGMHRVSLEVTAANAAAVGLYRDVGFRVTRTMYRTVDPAPYDH